METMDVTTVHSKVSMWVAGTSSLNTVTYHYILMNPSGNKITKNTTQEYQFFVTSQSIWYMPFLMTICT